MAKIGGVPEFTNEDTEADVESTSKEEEMTSGEETPSEAATEDEPSEEPKEPADDAGAQEKEIKEIVGLRQEKEKLIKDLKDLRGERRELKQREIDRVEEKIDQKVDDLADVHPDDAKIIERVLRAKGYVSQSEVNKMLFEAKKQEVISTFLHEFPEYKPENDPKNEKWGQIIEEISLYRKPDSAEDYDRLLRRAHRLVAVTSASGPSVAVKKHNVQVASAGSGGTRKPSPPNRLAQLAEQHLQGFTQEEIAEMQKRLSQR